MRFAKIIELENGEQVLAVIGMSNSKDGYRMQVVTNYNGVTNVTDLGFGTQEQRQKGFDSIGIDFAKTFYNATVEHVKNNPDV